MGMDRYTFQARLAPVFILLVPLGLAFIALFPSASLVSAILTLLGTLSLQTLATILLSELGRDAGKRKEPRLYDEWGGMPTDLILSHQSTILDRTTMERYKNKIQSLLPDIIFPEPQQENQDQQKAVEIYRSCTNFLRERTRDTERFKLLFNENVSYGFRRNLWAMRPAGIFVAIIGIVACVFALLDPGKSFAQVTSVYVSLILNVAMLTLWLFRFTSEWVRIPAAEYAKQLFAACENL